MVGYVNTLEADAFIFILLPAHTEMIKVQTVIYHLSLLSYDARNKEQGKTSAIYLNVSVLAWLEVLSFYQESHVWGPWKLTGDGQFWHKILLDIKEKHSLAGTAEGREDFYKQFSLQAVKIAFALTLLGLDNASWHIWGRACLKLCMVSSMLWLPWLYNSLACDVLQFSQNMDAHVTILTIPLELIQSCGYITLSSSQHSPQKLQMSLF